MKTDRRWVAWMAALLFAATLAATTRESTAGPHGPYIVPDQDPTPVFGEPDQPPSGPMRATWDVPWLRSIRLNFIWPNGLTRPVVMVDVAARRPQSLPTRKHQR
jgi:hypothetical protein